MSASASIKLSLTALLTQALDLATGSVPLNYNQDLALSDGTGANQIKNIFHDQRTLAASATEDLDLAGSLANAFGTTITFTKIKALIIKAADDNVNNVVVGDAAATAWEAWTADAGSTISIKPGGLLVITAPDATGLAVGAGATDKLKIANSSSGTSVTYDIIVLGTE